MVLIIAGLVQLKPMVVVHLQPLWLLRKQPGSGLISGTHVTAKINLNTNAVEGNLYNKWYDGALNGVKDVRLVDFTGSMSENGNIAGTSHNNINNTWLVVEVTVLTGATVSRPVN